MTMSPDAPGQILVDPPQHGRHHRSGVRFHSGTVDLHAHDRVPARRCRLVPVRVHQAQEQVRIAPRPTERQHHAPGRGIGGAGRRCSALHPTRARAVPTPPSGALPVRLGHRPRRRRRAPRETRYERSSTELRHGPDHGIRFLLAVFLTMNRPSPVLVITTTPLSKYGVVAPRCTAVRGVVEEGDLDGVGGVGDVEDPESRAIVRLVHQVAADVQVVVGVGRAGDVLLDQDRFVEVDHVPDQGPRPSTTPAGSSPSSFM